MKLITTSPAACGMNRNPETFAEAPSEVWMNVGRKIVAENSTALERTAIMPVSTYIRLRKSDMGMMAFGCRTSSTTNSTSNAPAATSSPTVIAEPQP